jgi:hypothetical protein
MGVVNGGDGEERARQANGRQELLMMMLTMMMMGERCVLLMSEREK